MFGKESAGIPEEILKAHPDTCVRIPMIGETRSLNLSNAVAIVLYEALRQNHFDHMKLEGCLLYTSDPIVVFFYESPDFHGMIVSAVKSTIYKLHLWYFFLDKKCQFLFHQFNIPETQFFVYG